MSGKRKNIINVKFTRLTVVSVFDWENENGKGGPLYNCVCDCGNTFIAAHEYLIKGTRKSCGCLKKELDEKFTSSLVTHGLTKHPLYSTWRSMLARCYNQKNSNYHNYGGRGITVCDRWLEKDGLINFIKDMGERPDGLSLDRVDNNGNYTPENCRWASKSLQHFNKRQKDGKELPKGIRCITLKNGESRYTAYITCKGVVKFLGYFQTIEDALTARRVAELELFGEESPQ